MPPAQSSRPTAPAPTPPPAPRTLPLARASFLDAVRRDTPGTDLARYTAVLDALLAWSAARPARLRFRADPGPASVLRFECATSKRVLWTARPVRGAAPALELAPPAGSEGGTPTAAGRARAAAATATLNAHARAVLADGDRLRISFGALKNAAALAAVLALLDDLTDRPGEDRPDGRPDADPAVAAGT
jgi:hypothetical protein